MTLGKRTDYGDAKYAGIALDFTLDVETPLQVCVRAPAEGLQHCITNLQSYRQPLHAPACSRHRRLVQRVLHSDLQSLTVAWHQPPSARTAAVHCVMVQVLRSIHLRKRSASGTVDRALTACVYWQERCNLLNHPATTSATLLSQDALLCGFDFAVMPLVRPDYRPPAPAPSSSGQMVPPFKRDDVLYLPSSARVSQVIWAWSGSSSAQKGHTCLQGTPCLYRRGLLYCRQASIWVATQLKAYTRCPLPPRGTQS